MAKNKSRKPAYELTREETNHRHERYQSLKLVLLMPDPWSGREYKRAATLRWQAHWRSSCGGDTGPSGWYGYHLEVSESDRFDELECGFMMLKRVAKLMEGKDHSPANALTAVLDLGWERMIYDPRVSHHLPEAKVLPPEYSAWMFDYERCGEVSNPCSFVLARDRDDAKQMMAVELVKDLTWGVVERMKLCAKWVELGQPIECLTGKWGGMYQAPKVVATEELLRSPLEEATMKAKAEANANAAEAEAAAAAVEMVVSG
jgi:hypothetical protein